MDRFDNVIKRNILNEEYFQPLPRTNQTGYIDFQILFDNFDEFYRKIRCI